jgi:hypothetical protein
MTPDVELFSATDPVHVEDRRVWYWTEFKGVRSERLNDYTPVLRQAEALMARHGACLIDRSDKGSGLLLASLGK